MIKLPKNAFWYVIFISVLVALYEIFSPVTYPILLLLTGNGRFNDWWLSLDSVNNYPRVADTICTIPWVFAYVLSAMHSNLGNFLSHIVYIIFSILIFTISYNKLNLKFDKIYSLLLIFSYPVMFGFWRGNTDFLIYGLILASYFYGTSNQFARSLIYFGSAVAFKPYQIFLLFSYTLNILKRNYMVLISGSLGVMFLIYFSNNNFFTSSYAEILKCGEWYMKEYAIGDGGTLHNNSLWGLFKLIVYFFYKSKADQVRVVEFFSIYLNIWPIILIVIFFVLNSFIKIFKSDENRFSTKFLLICLLIPLLSPIVPDYRLFFINVVLIICLTNNISENISTKFLISMLLFILIPKEFLWFSLGGAWFTPNGPLNCIAMLILLFYLAATSFKCRFANAI